MKTITIIGRRWFNRSTGNTYHSSQIIIDGDIVEGVEFAYGYGDHYVTTAFQKLRQLGLVNAAQNEMPWTWADTNGVKLTYTATDVQRKKDL